MPQESWKVPSEEVGIQLGKFLKARLGDACSMKRIKHVLAGNACYVNGKAEQFSTHILLPNDHVQVQTALFFEQGTLHSIQSDRILFEDTHLLIYNKPPNMTAHHNGHLHAQLRKRCPSIRVAHRLDKETSGAIIFPKTEEAQRALEHMFRERSVHKEYLAVADGSPEKETGCISNNLGKVFQDGDFVIWGQKEQGGVSAVTEWKVEKRGRKATLFRCIPKSGRTHQIRIHLSDMQHPILGDGRYGRHQRYAAEHRAPRCLLHAHRLRFRHPCANEVVSVEAPIPEDMQKAIKELM